MIVGRGKAKLAVFVLLGMLSNIVPVQGQGVQTRSSAPVLEEALESPLYVNLLTQGIEKLEPTGLHGAAVTTHRLVRAAASPLVHPNRPGSREQNVRSAGSPHVCAYHSAQKPCAYHYSYQAGTPPTPMILDKTPLASSGSSIQPESSSDSPMYIVALAAAIDKLEPVQSVARPVQKPQKGTPAWPARQIYNCPTYTTTCSTTCTGGSTCNGSVTCIAQTCQGSGTTCWPVPICTDTLLSSFWYGCGLELGW